MTERNIHHQHGKKNEPAPEDIEDPYAEDTPLTWIFGNHSKVRIISALLSEADRDLNITDIARIAGISRSAVYDNIDDLLQLNIVRRSRRVGDSKMYEINKENEAVKLVARLENKLLEDFYE